MDDIVVFWLVVAGLVLVAAVLLRAAVRMRRGEIGSPMMINPYTDAPGPDREHVGLSTVTSNHLPTTTGQAADPTEGRAEGPARAPQQPDPAAEATRRSEPGAG